MSGMKPYGLVGVTMYSTLIYVLLSATLGGLVSIAFLFVLPPLLGLLTVVLMPRRFQTRSSALFAPWVPIVVLTVLGMLLWNEVMVCICMAMPLMLVGGSLGGITTYWLLRLDADAVDRRVMSVVLFLPLLVGAVEGQFTPPDSFQSVERERFIAADAQTVWQTMAEVPTIAPSEWEGGVYTWLGLPQPQQALLNREGRGGVRRATYDNGLTLQEPITVWEPYQRLVFEVIVSPDSPEPYNRVGGRHFDVQEVGFWIEEKPGGVVLHLHSRYRLTTWFNPYGQLWVDWLLGDLQEHILEVIKTRAEAG